MANLEASVQSQLSKLTAVAHVCTVDDLIMRTAITLRMYTAVDILSDSSRQANRQNGTSICHIDLCKHPNDELDHARSCNCCVRLWSTHDERNGIVGALPLKRSLTVYLFH